MTTMNTPTFILLILTLAIMVPIIFIIANPHWLCYWLRCFYRLPKEPDVAKLQHAYFTDFIGYTNKKYFSITNFQTFTKKNEFT